MNTWLRLILFAVAAVACSLTSQAHEIVYTASLTGPNENPPNSSVGVGFVRITIDFDLFTMRVEASFDDLQGTVTAAHVHAATTVPFTGNAGVATQTPTFQGFPSGVLSGSYDHTFDMAQASSYNPDFIAANGGTIFTASNAFFAALDQGRAYFNIHTGGFPGGEIRGFLVEPRGIASLTHFENNTVHLECFGRAEAVNVIESSTDLQNFTKLGAVKADKEGLFEFDDTSAGSRKFYRIGHPE